MHISSFQLNNYKSYKTSERLDLTAGFNVITGQNNAGKTALLEGLSLRFAIRPHSSLKTRPTTESQLEQRSWADVSFTVSAEELKKILFTPNDRFYIPVPIHTSTFSQSVGLLDYDPPTLRRLVDWVLDHKSFKFSLRLDKGSWAIPHLPSFDLYDEVPNAEGTGASLFAPCIAISKDEYSITGVAVNMDRHSEIGTRVAGYIQSRTYSFSAQRSIDGTGVFGMSTSLQHNASNLAEVLNVLQSNAVRYMRFNETVRQIFPRVRWVSIRPWAGASQGLEIVVWTEDPASERMDLAIPLSESGTGIGQVLAILYVVLNSDYSQTIIIDEPQSFLHPGAVRKLIEILKSHSQHQFIISTHSPHVITAANPETITLVRQDGPESHMESINVGETEQLRIFLIEIGARLSDVFGADNILWVEGKTEEICFPMILEKIGKVPLMGTAIIGLRNTGDLEGRHAQTVFEIYEKLSQGKGLLPPAIGFILDKEGRTERELADIQRQSRQRVQFLPRRLYENYLLNPEAIASVLNASDGSRKSPITSEDVKKWINGKKNDSRYGATSGERGTNGVELAKIHGALLLADLFSDFSMARVAFDKISHSIALTEWMIENSPDDLGEIVELLRKMLARTKDTD